MNDIPVEIISFLKEKASNVKNLMKVKMLLMDEIGITGKDAKKYAKWWIKGVNGNK